MNDTQAMNAIHAVLSGNEWDSDTMTIVGEIVLKTGRVILDPNDVEGE
jgi:hypothetical protein